MEQDNQLVEERKRKFLIAMPILVIPFITMLFYSLGGGNQVEASSQSRFSALSTTLPDPMLDDQKPMDKLSLYQKATKDSLDKLQRETYDPFAEWMPVDTNHSHEAAQLSPYSYSAANPPKSNEYPINAPLTRSPEAVLERKIAELEKTLQTTDTQPVLLQSSTVPPSAETTPELLQLEALMQSFSSKQQLPDMELTQAETLMEKILDVQHPERVKDRLRKSSLENKKSVYAVTAQPEAEINDLLTVPLPQKPNELLKQYDKKSPLPLSASGFYDEDNEPEIEQNALLATTHENQTLVSGATIKIRLEQNAYLQGQLIPKGSFVYGTCTLNGERLQVSISSIRYGNSIYPVSLVAYDMDGLAGIRIPGSINRDVSKESSERAIQTLNMGSLDPSIGAQASAAGIEAAKNLLTRKVKRIKVTVKAGYPLLLAADNTNS